MPNNKSDHITHTHTETLISQWLYIGLSLIKESSTCFLLVQIHHIKYFTKKLWWHMFTHFCIYKRHGKCLNITRAKYKKIDYCTTARRGYRGVGGEWSLEQRSAAFRVFCACGREQSFMRSSLVCVVKENQTICISKDSLGDSLMLQTWTHVWSSPHLHPHSALNTKDRLVTKYNLKH